MDALEPVKDRKKEITVMTRYVRGDCPVLCIYFEDSGIGLEGIDKNKIFEPFFTTKEPGKGMGLAIIKEVVSELGGTISLFEESKIGVTFIIKIPIDVTGGNNAKIQHSNRRR
jgi:signal transduction histidine kinase